jgi:hypothetical protein
VLSSPYKNSKVRKKPTLTGQSLDPPIRSSSSMTYSVLPYRVALPECGKM